MNILNCPQCLTQILNVDINIASDVAKCARCNNIFKISENLPTQIDNTFDFTNPPSGAWIYEDLDKSTIGATTRSWLALFLVPFILVWSGGSLGGIYGSQILSGDFNPFMSLFGIPFLIGTVIFGSLAIMTTAGKVEIYLDEEGGKIFTGVWIIGYSSYFKWREVSQIKEDITTRSRGGATKTILIEGSKRISFGSMLNESRRYYLLKTLQQMLVKKKRKGNFI
jgi:uncharacterized protein YbaR (Trm112 family)